MDITFGTTRMLHCLMPQFISKLQHNTYEKGEFSDEQPRDLGETIRLIKDFPWDLERSLTDIQLTGPSVTIQNDDVNYLKLGLYFGGKFCVYYLDKDNHLYEYHAANIEAAEKLVADFFNQTLELSIFDKHFFNIGNQPHFITNNFEYGIKPRRIAIVTCIPFIYVLLFAGVLLDATKSNRDIVVPALSMLAIGGVILSILYRFFENRRQYLQISRGNDRFSFGQDKKSIVACYKRDIREIIIYGGRGSGRSSMFEVTGIVFNNNQCLKLSNLLISRHDLLSKFPDKLRIPVIYDRD
jgi:hypothetical protein